MEDVRRALLAYALQNAIKHGGKALVQPVVSKLLGSKPELRRRAREIVEIANEVVAQVNAMSIEEQKALLERLDVKVVQVKSVGEREGLPPLPNAQVGKVVTRFAPNPDFVLHLGSARPAILSYEYARMYKGKFILRFEDTDPKTKAPMLEAYDMIREDLRWLGVKWDEEYIQSLRMEIYYRHAERLLEIGGAYVCTCSRGTIRNLRARGVRCACSARGVDEQLELWRRMLEGEFKEGEAVVRVKTDIKHPNPSVRDWIAFRIIDTERYPHPLTGSKYVVWPTYNFACAVDDHLMGVTHILRGVEHEINTLKQKYVYDYFGWNYPVAVHFGRLSIEGAVLSKSRMREGLERGLYTGLDDPRLPTLRALRRRGILPATIWELIIKVGIKPSGARISLENLYAINRKHLEPKANRYMFISDPHRIAVKTDASELVAKIPRHPSYPERGTREIRLIARGGIVEVYVPREDFQKLSPGNEVRLLGLANVRVLSDHEAEIVNFEVNYARSKGLPIVQWCPLNSTRVTVLKADKDDLLEIKGLAEPGIKEMRKGEHAQFYRFGFVILEDPDSMLFVYTHS